jgi:predicted GNAT family N-acyltransferase
VPQADVHVVQVSFQDYEEEIRRIRNTVFSREQGIDANLDFDGLDPGSVQVIARDEHGSVVGTARMLGDGHVGRIAVLAHRRGLGIGSRLVEGLMRIAAERGLGNVYLNSQINAVGFYRALNFEAVGDPFMEADIEHLRMERQLDPS